MDEAKVIYAFPGCIHVEVRHPSSLLESPEVEAALKGEARRWAKVNGRRLGSRISQGWTLGPEYSESRNIYTIREKS